MARAAIRRRRKREEGKREEVLEEAIFVSRLPGLRG